MPLPSVATTMANRTKSNVAVRRSTAERAAVRVAACHHTRHAKTRPTDSTTLTNGVANISPSMICMPSDVAAINVSHENCSTRSFSGSRICPAEMTTPTPAGSNASSRALRHGDHAVERARQRERDERALRVRRACAPMRPRRARPTRTDRAREQQHRPATARPTSAQRCHYEAVFSLADEQAFELFHDRVADVGAVEFGAFGELARVSRDAGATPATIPRSRAGRPSRAPAETGRQRGDCASASACLLRTECVGRRGCDPS